MTDLVIDLCSGYGGATQAFNTEVVKIDVSRKVKPTIQADVEHLPLRPKLKPVLLWMSPPCTYLSNADRKFPRPGIKHNFNVIGACLEAVSYLQPRVWVMENPKGRLRWFRPPNYTIENPSGEYKHKLTDLWSSHRSLKRAFIPKSTSEKIVQFVSMRDNDNG